MSTFIRLGFFYGLLISAATAHAEIWLIADSSWNNLPYYGKPYYGKPDRQKQYYKRHSGRYQDRADTYAKRHNFATPFPTNPYLSHEYSYDRQKRLQQNQRFPRYDKRINGLPKYRYGYRRPGYNNNYGYSQGYRQGFKDGYQYRKAGSKIGN